MTFFRKALKFLEPIEPHIKLTTEHEHIDYLFSGFEDDDIDSISVSDDEDDKDDSDAYSDTPKDDIDELNNEKALKFQETIEPHIKLTTEHEHIDYLFSGFEDDDIDSISVSDDEDDKDDSDAYSDTPKDDRDELNNESHTNVVKNEETKHNAVGPIYSKWFEIGHNDDKVLVLAATNTPTLWIRWQLKLNMGVCYYRELDLDMMLVPYSSDPSLRVVQRPTFLLANKGNLIDGKSISSESNGLIMQPEDSEYDADSSVNEEVNDYADVMIDEEDETHTAGVEIHLFGLRESDYQLTNIGVSSEVPDNVFMEKDSFKMDIDVFDTDLGGEGDCPSGRISALNKLKKAIMQDEGDNLRVRASCFGVMAGKREILGLDGAIMKDPYPGQVLTVVGIDANNEHRFWQRHIHENMKQGWSGKLFKESLWKCAAATT
nr:putative arfaptin homology (AH) domain/BAR domain protein [Tanacetum cinerariifolium]